MLMFKISFNIGLYALGIAVLISIAFPQPKLSEIPVSEPIPIEIVLPSKPLYRDVDLFCLAKNIFHESGTEPEIGKYAVAQVTINRLRSSNYPNNICSVVLDPYQFSWANNNSLHWTTPRGPNWERSYLVAKDVLDGNRWMPVLDHVQYFHADYVNPKWANDMTYVTQIGRHIFYTSY